ncbi:MAG: hypothetical protein L6V83_02300 [Christensenella sp.]|nr:MAG: hypothetical protein L6V83_02300 [Christensenella sp.]
MKNCHAKNIFSILGTIAICVCLALCVLACVLLPLSVAQADSSMNVIVAPVSNLEGNATAGASSIKLIASNYEFYIPESYYLTNLKSAVKQYYTVTYCGFEFFFESETSPQTSTVTFQDGVSPLSRHFAHRQGRRNSLHKRCDKRAYNQIFGLCHR